MLKKRLKWSMKELKYLKKKGVKRLKIPRRLILIFHDEDRH